MAAKPAHTLADMPQQVQAWIGERMVEEVECVIPDMVGFARGKAMPMRKFEAMERMYLSPSLFYQTVSGDYADLDWSTLEVEHDMTMIPDISTARSVPWSQDVTLQVICDLVSQTGEPVAFSPRNVLRRVLDLYAKKGWQPVVAPEMEFYITRPNLDPAKDIEPPIGRTGRISNARKAYSISGVDDFGPIIDDIYDFAEAQGLEIDTMIQEDGAGQLEINLKHGDPMALADQVFSFKRMIREAALRHDSYATFMAKPMEDQPGSAMHLHVSVLDRRGKNVFTAPNGGRSKKFLSFIGGLQAHLPAAVLILAPYVNSYRRLVPDSAAPINLEWGKDNRSVGLREPVSDPVARRIENRVTGMDANPYLAIAATLACGYLGLTSTASPRDPVNRSGYELPHSLPRSVLFAAEKFEKAKRLHSILGTEFCDLYLSLKRSELNEYLQVISPWEREHLMLTV